MATSNNPQSGGYVRGRLATASGIDAKVVAAIPLYTVPGGKKLVIESAFIRVTGFTSGGKSVDAVFNIGGNNPDYNDFYFVGGLPVTAIDQRVELAPTIEGIAAVHTAGQVITLNITTGSNATLETWTIDIFGYLVNN